MDRLRFDAPFSADLAALPVHMQAERVVVDTLQMLWRRIQLLILSMILALATGAVLLALIEKRYTAEAVLQLDFSVQEASYGVQEQTRGVLVEAGPMVQSEARIIRSRPVARRVVETLGLADQPDYAEDGMSLPYRLTYTAERFARLLLTSSAAEETRAAREPEVLHEARIGRAVDSVLQRLVVSSDSRSYLVSITYTSQDPVLSARIANAFAEEYLRRRQQGGIEAAERTSAWLTTRIRNTEAELRHAEAQIEAFRTHTGLLEPARTDGGTDPNGIQQQRLLALMQQLSTATATRTTEERRLVRVEDLLRAGTLPSATDIPGLPLVSLLLEREAAARRDLSEVTSRFGPRHPDVLQAQAGLADIRARLQSELGRAIPVLRSDAETARRAEEDLQRRVDTLQAAIAASKQHETQLRNLIADAQAIRERLMSLARSNEIAVAARARASSIASLVSPADPPRSPTAPRPLVIMALSLLGGLSAGIGTALLLERRDRGLRSSDDIRRALDLRCLGMAPAVSPKKSGPAKAAYDEAMYAVCASLDLFSTVRDCRVVLVTSSLPDEGKSDLCRGMANAINAAGKRVMLIGGAGADARQWNTLDTSTSPAQTGTRSAGLPVPAASLVLIDRKRSFSRTTDVSGPGSFGQLLEEARRHFDVILLEGEPVMMVADSLVLGRLADNIVHVARWGTTRRRIVSAAIQRMREHALMPDGVVLMQVDLQKHAQSGVVDECTFYVKESRYYERLAHDKQAGRGTTRHRPGYDPG